MYFRNKLMIIVTGLFVLFFIGLGIFAVVQTRIFNRSINNERIALHELLTSMSFNWHFERIRYYDEALAHSVKSYALTGDSNWKDRYLTVEPLLDGFIQDAILLSPSGEKNSFSSINNSRARLAQIEKRALLLIDNSQISEANVLLTSSEYKYERKMHDDTLAYITARTELAAEEEQLESPRTLTRVLTAEEKRMTRFNVYRNALTTGLFATILASVFLVTCLFSKPLSELKNTAIKLSKGDFSVRASINSNDEIAEIGKVFNQMIHGLKSWKQKTVMRENQLRKSTAALDNALAKLKNSYKKLKALDKLKTEFLQSTSHELRTPLTSLRGFVELMREKQLGKITKKQSEALTVIHYDVERLTNMITKILETSKIEAGTKKKCVRFDFNTLVKEVVSALSLAAKKKKLALILKLKKLPSVTADREQITQVLMNLVHNAIKYTDTGAVTINTMKEGKSVLFSITDTGIGIKKEFLPFLFSKFFQVTHTTSGSGLGLYICKRVVELHKGRIWAESQPGKGSTFYFTLPINKSKLI